MAIDSGLVPTLTEPTTALSDVRITETVPLVRLATYTLDPSALATIPVGAEPTTIGLPTTAPVLVLITVTYWCLDWSRTPNRPPSPPRTGRPRSRSTTAPDWPTPQATSAH